MTAWRGVAGGVVLHVRATPRGGRDAIDGVRILADGRAVLALRVSVPPEDGGANRAVCALVAKATGLARGAVTLTDGQRSREKTLMLAGDADAILPRLKEFER